MKLKTTKWSNFDFNTDGWSSTHENRNDAVRQLVRDMRSDLRKLLKGSEWELHNLKRNGFMVSGFFRNKVSGNFIYVRVSDVRHFDWFDSVLVRTAKHDRDWTGGTNHFFSFDVLVYNLDKVR